MMHKRLSPGGKTVRDGTGEREAKNGSSKTAGREETVTTLQTGKVESPQGGGTDRYGEKGLQSTYGPAQGRSSKPKNSKAGARNSAIQRGSIEGDDPGEGLLAGLQGSNETELRRLIRKRRLKKKIERPAVKNLEGQDGFA